MTDTTDPAATPVSTGNSMGSSMGSPAGTHIPVMLEEVLASLAPRDGGRYCDGTFGGGGYAAAILSAAGCTLWAIDRDPDAIARGAAVAARFPGRLHLVEGRFGAMVELLAERGVTALDGVVLDLGVSSFQIDQPARGFSFRGDGPLDMRMERAGESAADLVNDLPESELADILWTLGEERHSRRIARAIVAARRESRIETTGRLVEIIHAVMPRDPSGIDSATRSFQALRLRVNDELGEVQRGIEAAAALLAPGGRLVVVSFHSLEDRIVKRFMLQASGRAPGRSRHDPGALQEKQAPSFTLVTPRALRPGEAETRRNPRARSARLRAIERIAEAA
jgi:16S rRNA (cytosine1402-N4)-methyltransferase